MCRGVDDGAGADALDRAADVLAHRSGPRAGRLGAGRCSIRHSAASGARSIDADALNLLAQSPRANAHWILTPHPGEAARLLGKTAAEVQRDRLGAARAIAARYGGTVVLKGAGTLVVSRRGPACDLRPRQSRHGFGRDGRRAHRSRSPESWRRGADLAAAARVGVLVHALAGDMAARRGERGLLATDLLAYLPTCVNPHQRS